MKVLFFASDYRIGLSSLLTDEALALHRRNIPLHCIAGEGEQEPGLRSQLEREGVPLTIVEGMDAHHRFRHLAQRVACIMREQEITHVHVQNNWQLALVAYVKGILRHKVKVVYTLHGFRHNHFFKSLVARLLIGGMLWLTADRIICMSRYLQSVFWPLKYKTVLLPLGVSDVFFEECPLPPVGEAGLQLVYPAQFRQGKNQEEVIRAFAAYLGKTNDEKAHLYLPGSGGLWENSRKLVIALQLEGRVTLPGQCTREEILALYRQSNVAVVASNSETFGQSIVEPWVMGRIVVSRPVGIAPDMIRHGENGFLFQSRESLCDTLVSIYSGKVNGEQIAKQAFFERRVFCWADIAEKYKAMLTGAGIK